MERVLRRSTPNMKLQNYYGLEYENEVRIINVISFVGNSKTEREKLCEKEFGASMVYKSDFCRSRRIFPGKY